MTTYRKEITIESSQVTADQSDFPVLLSLASDAQLAARCQSEGQDIFITKSDGKTKVPHEIELFDDATGQLILWFKADVAAAADATYYLNYGNANQRDTQNAAGVWDDNYLAVYHAMTGQKDYANATNLWSNTPRAAYHNGRTYLVWLDFPNTDLYIAYYDHSTNAWSTPVNIQAAKTQNAHASPTIAIDSDGYLYVFYCNYADPGGVYMRKSTTAEDPSAWDTEVTVNADGTASYYTYPNPIVLSDDTLVLFYRKTPDGGSGPADIYRIISTDGGDNWTNDQQIVEALVSGRPYFQARLGPSDRVHLAWHTYIAGDTTNRDLYYAYTDNPAAATSAWKAADGTALTLTLWADADALVFDSDAAWDELYLLGLAPDANNKPHLVAGLYDAVATNKLVHFEYSSSAWNSHDILEDDGVGIVFTGNDVSDGAVISSAADALQVVFTLENSDGLYDIKEYQTANGGSTWTKIRDITSGNNMYNLMPEYPCNANDECRIVWYTALRTDYSIDHAIYWAGSDNSYAAEAAKALVPVAHLPDSTANNHHAGDDNTPPAVSGGIGYGWDYNGATQRHRTATLASLAFTGAFTFEFWHNADALSVDDGLMSLQDAAPSTFQNLRIWQATGGEIRCLVGYGPADIDYTTTGLNMLINTDYYIAIVWDKDANSGKLEFYKNGTNVEDSSAGHTSAIAAAAVNFVLGSDDAESDHFDGTMDEVRYSNVARPAGWLATTYNNMSAPASFITLGTEEEAPIFTPAVSKLSVSASISQ